MSACLQKIFTHNSGWHQYFDNDNQKYIEYLIKSYLTNVAAELHQFAFVSFHLLFMSFIYKTVWLLTKERHKNVDQFIDRLPGDLQNPSSPFDFSTIAEKDSFQILRCLGFHKNDIDFFSTQVNDAIAMSAESSSALNVSTAVIPAIPLPTITYENRFTIFTPRTFHNVFPCTSVTELIMKTA